MKIHLRQISPEGTHLEGEEPCLIPELETEGVRCTGEMHYSLDVGISEGDIWANGSLTQPVELQCVSCLDRFVDNIVVPAFAAHVESTGSDQVDLGPLMREDILLNLPPHPRCDQNGDKVCRAASIPKDPAEERENSEAKREHDWGELNKLDLG